MLELCSTVSLPYKVLDIVSLSYLVFFQHCFFLCLIENSAASLSLLTDSKMNHLSALNIQLCQYMKGILFELNQCISVHSYSTSGIGLIKNLFQIK